MIGLLDRSPRVLERSEIVRLPHTTVTVKESHRKSSTYSGVLLMDLLLRAGSDSNTHSERGDLGKIVVVEGVEDPSVVFALTDLDSTLTDNRVLLADSKDGKPLAAPEGPFRIIVKGDKEPARWVRHVWAIYVVNVVEAREGT